MPTVCYQVYIIYQKLEILPLHIIFKFNKSSICKLYPDSQVCRDSLSMLQISNGRKTTNHRLYNEYFPFDDTNRHKYRSVFVTY